jgi:flagellar basal body P-ring formation protein FlgA
LKRLSIIFAFLMIGMAVPNTDIFAKDTASSPIYAAVRQYIEANMPWPSGAARIDFLTEETESKTHSNNISLRVEPAGNPSFIGDMVFLVRSFKGGNLLRTESVRVRIEVLQNLVIAVKTLPSGSILTEKDVTSVQRWVRRIHPQSLPSLDTVQGKRLTLQVSSGSEILSSMLKEAPLVKKGKMVRMVYDNGLMHIVTIGLSEEDGVAGNIVRIKNISSNKIIFAKVLSDSLVGVEF